MTRLLPRVSTVLQVVVLKLNLVLYLVDQNLRQEDPHQLMTERERERKRTQENNRGWMSRGVTLEK